MLVPGSVIMYQGQLSQLLIYTFFLVYQILFIYRAHFGLCAFIPSVQFGSGSAPSGLMLEHRLVHDIELSTTVSSSSLRGKSS